MPLSKCFYTMRNIQHMEYWEFAGPYITIWIFLSTISTLILYYSGSVRPVRIYTWLAKWKCFKGCYSTPLMEILSWLLFILTMSPGITLLVWGFATYYWDFSYTGFNSDGTAGVWDPKYIGNYDNCKTLTFLRLGMFTWYFREWIMQRTTSLFVSVGSLLMLLFTFLLSTTVENYDDVMTAASFLTLSALFFARILYNYFDDLGIDLNDYLYRSEDSEEDIRCKGSSITAGEKRWSATTYMWHAFGNLITLFCYALAGIWIDTRTSSPMYVYPWVQAVDLAVAFGLHKAKARGFAEVATAFVGVVGFRIVVIYLGMQDRHDRGADCTVIECKPGAWEFVEPTFFMMATIVGVKAVADDFWKIKSNDTTEIVAEDRYSQWLAIERQAVVKRRDATSRGCSGKIRSCLFSVGQYVGFSDDVSRKSSYDLAEAEIKALTIEMLDRKALEIYYEKERDFRIFQTNMDEEFEKEMNAAGTKRKLRQDSTGKDVKTGKPMSDEDVEGTIDRLAQHRECREKITTQLRLLQLRKITIAYRYIFLLTLIHVVYSIVVWYTRDPIDRKIWPFTNTARASNFAWLAVVVGFGAYAWTFVYGAMTSYVIMNEDMDNERHSVREMLFANSASEYQVSARGDIRKPKPLSFHHNQARDRHKSGKSHEESIHLAIGEQVDKNRGMLTSERPKIAAEAATCYTLREWCSNIREWNKKKTHDVQDLVDFVHGPAFDEDYIQSRQPPVDDQITTSYQASYNDARHEAEEHDADCEGDVAIKRFRATAFDKTIARLAQLAVVSIAKSARKAAEENGGSNKEQIGAAIMATALAHSFFQSANYAYTLKSSKVLCTSVAVQESNEIGYNMTAQQKLLAWSEHTFMDRERLSEITEIGSSETRWPPIGGLNKNKIKDIFKFQEVVWQAGCGAIAGNVLGFALSGFLAIVLAYDTGDNTSWLGLNTKGNQRNLLFSIFLPWVGIDIAIVARSWARNKYYFWSRDLNETVNITLAQRFSMYKYGLMRKRDRTNVRMVLHGCLMTLAWFIITCIVVTVEEAFAVTAGLIALLTTVIPIVRGKEHRRASSFSDVKDLFIYGFAVVVVMLVFYWIISDDWALPGIFCLYYTLVCFYLTYYRTSYMNGWEDHNLLASIDKNSIFPFAGFLACIYQWYKDQIDGDSKDDRDTKRAWFLVGMGCTTACLVALILFFYMAMCITEKFQAAYNQKKSSSRRKLRMNYLELNNVDLSRAETKKHGSTVGEDAPLKNIGDLDDEFESAMLREEEQTCCAKLCSWLSEHNHEVVMFILYILMNLGALLAMGFYAKDQKTTYSNEHRVMYFSSVLFGLHLVLFSGLSFVLDGSQNGESWKFSPSTLLPVIIPQAGDNDECDFKKGVVSSNVPTGCWYLGLACIGFWGIIACIMPDIDFMFDDAQMVVGVLAICLCLLGTVCGPFLAALQLNFSLARDYHHIAQKAVCMTPVTDVDRIVEGFVQEYCEAHTEMFDSKDPEDCEFTLEDMHAIAKGSFRKCFSHDFDGNDWAVPRDYFNANNKNYETGDVWSRDKFKEALDKLFPEMNEEPEPKKYRMNQFMLLFRSHCLQYGQMKWDNDFLGEKRDWAIKELKTCRALYTMQSDSLSARTKSKHYTPFQVTDSLQKELYPGALSTTFPCGGCSFKGSEEYPEFHPPICADRRVWWKDIYDKETYNVNLLLEKICFEGHFALAVAQQAYTMTSIDAMANYALHANGAVLTMTDDSEQQDENSSNHYKLPLQVFADPIAATVYDTRIPPGKKDADPLRDPKVKRQVSHCLVPMDQIEYQNSLKDILNAEIRVGVASGILDYYAYMRLLFEFYARASAPSGMKVKFEHRESGLGDLKIIDEDNWQAMFANLTPNSSLYDLYMKTEMLHDKWKLFCDPTCLKLENEPQEMGGCFDNLEAPIVYAASLFLEYYDVAMFVGIYASGNTRYGKFKEAAENNHTFRLFIERMKEEARKDPICKDKLNEQKAFTQVIQASQGVMESLERGCIRIFGEGINYVFRDANQQMEFSPSGKFKEGVFHADKIEPNMGPAVLREACLLLRSRTVYEVAFKCLVSTQRNSSPLDDCQGYPADTTISYEQLMQWTQRIRDHHLAQCAKSNITGIETKIWDDRFAFIKKGETFTCEQFVQLHPKVSDGDKYKVGNLCVESRHWIQFEDLLDDIKAVCIDQIMDLKQCLEKLASDFFDKSCKQTQDYDMMDWFRRWTGTVDDMFDNCFYFKNTSYLHHYSQTKNAVKEKVLDVTFERYQQEFRTNVLDGTYTNVPAEGSGAVEFQWKEGSMMDRANKMGLLYKGHRYLAGLCCLFMAPREVRRDWSAMYRVWRTIAMSRQDADTTSQKEGEDAETKESIRRHLSGVLGNSDFEERQIIKSTQIIYSNMGDPAAPLNVQLVSTDLPTAAADPTRTRGFVLLDRSEPFVRMLDQDQAKRDQAWLVTIKTTAGMDEAQAVDDAKLDIQIPETLDETDIPKQTEIAKIKADLWVLDTMLVVTSKKEVNFSTSIEQDKIKQSSSAETPSSASLHASDSNATDPMECSDDNNTVEVSVMRASINLPVEDVKQFPRKNEEWPYVLRVTGDRFVATEKKRRFYYLATFDEEDHNHLYRILRSKMRVIPLDTALVTAEANPVKAEGLGPEVKLEVGVSPDPAQAEGALTSLSQM